MATILSPCSPFFLAARVFPGRSSHRRWRVLFAHAFFSCFRCESSFRFSPLFSSFCCFCLIVSHQLTFFSWAPCPPLVSALLWLRALAASVLFGVGSWRGFSVFPSSPLDFVPPAVGNPVSGFRRNLAFFRRGFSHNSLFSGIVVVGRRCLFKSSRGDRGVLLGLAWPLVRAPTRSLTSALLPTPLLHR